MRQKKCSSKPLCVAFPFHSYITSPESSGKRRLSPTLERFHAKQKVTETHVKIRFSAEITPLSHQRFILRRQCRIWIHLYRNKTTNYWIITLIITDTLYCVQNHRTRSSILLSLTHSIVIAHSTVPSVLPIISLFPKGLFRLFQSRHSPYTLSTSTASIWYSFK